MGRSLRSLTARGGQPAARLYNASSTLAACTKPNLVNFGERLLCENDNSFATVAFLGQQHRGQPLCVRPLATVALLAMHRGTAATCSHSLPLAMYSDSP